MQPPYKSSKPLYHKRKLNALSYNYRHLVVGASSTITIEACLLIAQYLTFFNIHAYHY
nr:MAG TPA_asm: hypothetical protein [Caudoviricetes sp.]